MFQDLENAYSNCKYRNKFIIPLLIRELEHFKPSNVIDIGCSTGYISYKLLTEIRFDGFWSILDKDKNRLNFALRRISAISTVNPIKASLEEFFDKSGNFDFAILSNILLEMETINYQGLSGLVSKGGYLAIFIPDAISDILQLSTTKIGAALTSYQTGKVTIEDKVDKIANEPYPFIAHRPEEFIRGLTRAGFDLISVERYDNPRSFFFGFRRRLSSR